MSVGGPSRKKNSPFVHGPLHCGSLHSDNKVNTQTESRCTPTLQSVAVPSESALTIRDYNGRATGRVFDSSRLSWRNKVLLHSDAAAIKSALQADVVFSFRNPKGFAILKRLSRQTANQSPAPVQQTSLPPVQNAAASPPINDPTVKPQRDVDEHWRPQGDDDEIGDDESHAAETTEAMEAKRLISLSDAFEKEKNKENLGQPKEMVVEKPKPRAFVDPQPSAVRVTWDDSQSANEQSSAIAKKGKRAEPAAEDEEMSDPSEDESFQHNDRAVDVNRRRNVAPARQIPSRLTKKTRSTPPADESENEDTQDLLRRQLEREVEQYNRSPRSAPPSNSQARVAQEQKRINQLAKMKVRARNAGKVQRRQAWSEEETSALIEYIMEYGTSYALIKELDNEDQKILVDRDQVALKDKARNIKTDYIKYVATLLLPDCPKVG